MRRGGEAAPGGVERVVLLDDRGRAVGTAPKATVHHRETPLHLAFSCYVFDREGRLLVTRRAAGKRTWPSVWTNTLCGHPAPGEPITAAVRRRAGEELGIGLTELSVALPTFRYRAVMANGVVEHEICPVLTARTDDPPRPDPTEVDQTVWTAWEEFRDAVLTGRMPVSPWCVEQVRALAEAAGHPREVAGDETALPAAARADSGGADLASG